MHFVKTSGNANISSIYSSKQTTGTEPKNRDIGEAKKKLLGIFYQSCLQGDYHLEKAMPILSSRKIRNACKQISNKDTTRNLGHSQPELGVSDKRPDSKCHRLEKRD